MRNLKLNKTWSVLHNHISKNVNNISKDDNQINWNKEQLLMNKLERKLGKPKEEIQRLISKSLLDLLSMVPFSTEKK